MNITPVTSSYPHLPQLDALNRAAFPKEEYVPLSALVDMAATDHFDLWALEDGGACVGFMAVRLHSGLCYLCWLAVEPEQRSHGYGGQALAALRTQYPRLQQVVDIEMLDPAAPNKDQRVSRRGFYLRSGYRPTGHYVNYFDMDYEILCGDDRFDLAAFQQMFATIRVEGLKPTYF